MTRDQIDKNGLHDGDVYIHLAGKSIISLPRNDKNKKDIWYSRIDTTKTLVEHMPDSCHTFVCASAT
jgi:NAD dependent epimerase/dehydratase family enzyme